MGKSGLKDIKNQNTNLIMQQIMQARSISRIELAQETGLSPSTVSSIVGDLLGKGIIVETGMQTVEKGRSRKDLSIAADFGSVAIFEISRRSVFFCLFNMCLDTLESTCITKQRVTGNDLFELLVSIFSYRTSIDYIYISGFVKIYALVAFFFKAPRNG